MILRIAVLLVTVVISWIWPSWCSVRPPTILSVLHSVQLRDHNSTSFYGSLKSSTLSWVALDNRIRYCLEFGTRCMFTTASQLDFAPPPRIRKLFQIERAVLSSCRKCSTILYLDTDVVILDSEGGLLKTSVFSTNAKSVLAAAIESASPQRKEGDKDQYQTGVMFLFKSTEMLSLLAEWKAGYSSSRTSSQQPTASSTAATSIVTDSSPLDSDQMLLNTLLRKNSTLAGMVRTLVPKHRYNAFPCMSTGCAQSIVTSAPATTTGHANSSDRHSSTGRGNNASSGAEMMATLWKDQRLPAGDEVSGESLLVHFAGVYGGAGQEDGLSDPAVLLLAVHGYVLRHLRFLQALQARETERGRAGRQGAAGGSRGGRLSCKALEVVPLAAAEEVLTQMLTLLEGCAAQAFSVAAYVRDGSAATAERCLQEVRELSTQLLVSYEAAVRAIDAASRSERQQGIIQCVPVHRKKGDVT